MHNNHPPQNILIRMGIFRALYAAAVQFNSVSFRIIVGVLAIYSGIPADSIALVTLIEFLLNGILDVPFGYLADKLGRVPAIILSLTLIMIGLVCVYIGLLLHNETSRVFFIIHGVLIGIGKPLNSGSIEAFYQSALHRYNFDISQINASLTVSQNYGKYYTTASVLFALSLIFIFNYYHILAHTFVFGIALYGICIIVLWKDFLQLGDLDESCEHSSIRNIISSMMRHKSSKLSILYNLSFWMITVGIAGYVVVAFGRELVSPNSWIFMFSFMLGYSAFGWVLKGHLLPFLITRMRKKNYVIFLYTIIFLSSLSFIFLYKNSGTAFQSIYIFIFGNLFHVATSGIQNFSMNQLMLSINKKDYATALSFQNIPGFLWVGFYSVYLAIFKNGSPSVIEAFITTTIITLLFIFLTLIFEPNTKSV